MIPRVVTVFTIVVLAATTACGENAAPVDDRPPTVDDVDVVVAEDTPVTVTLSATDPDGDPVVVTVTPPANGTLVQDGLAVTYTPAPDFHGEEAVTITATAAARSATAQLRFRVTPVNDAPDARDDVLAGPEDTVATITAAALLANDRDVDGDPLAIIGVEAIGGGTVVLEGDQVVFTPAPRFAGVAAFRYTVTDGAASDVATVDLHVGDVADAPVVVDDAATTAEDVPVVLEVAALLANDLDPDGPALTLVAVDDAVHGTALLTGGAVTFTPEADYHGASSFTYTVSDGALTDVGTVTITVTPVNDPPSARADAARTVMDTPVQIPVADLLADDIDVDGDALTVIAVRDAIGGAVELSGDEVTFTPSAGFTGAATFVYDVADGAGGAGSAVVEVVVLSRAASVAVGTYHACAILVDGRVKCWGANAAGQLGLGDTERRGDEPGEMGAALPHVDLGTGRTASALALGWSHSCALLDDGTVKCWGANHRGQLGLGDIERRGDGSGEMGDALLAVDLGTGRTAVALAAGDNHTCAVLDDGAVKCWGSNGDGRLGLGDTEHRGDDPGEMGDSLPAVDLGAGRTARAVGTGSGQSCALLDDGAVKCWGSGHVGQLGLGDTEPRGDEPGDMGDDLPAVELGDGRVVGALVVGVSRACVVLDDGAVKCWGEGANGGLGLGDTEHRGDEPGEMGDALPTIPLAAGLVPRVLVSGAHSCVIGDDDSVRCWGRNVEGGLGLGDTENRGDAPGEMESLPPVEVDPTRGVVALAAGWYTTCAILDDGAVKCWGANSAGALGLGDTWTRGDGPGEMGAALPEVDL